MLISQQVTGCVLLSSLLLMFWQLFVNGEHVGDGASVLEMNEAGDLEERLAGFMVR